MATATAHSQAQAAPAPLPFRVGTQPTALQDTVFPAQSLGAGTITLNPYNPTPNSFLSGLWIQVTSTVSANVTNVVTAAADGPFNVIQSLSFTDTNQKPIVGPINGYDLYLINKYGGYFGANDPRTGPNYQAIVTGSGSTAGSFAFFLYLPLEVDVRDSLASLENKSTQSSYHLNITLNTETAVYGSVSPSVAPSVVVTVVEDGYLQPVGSDPAGAPFATAPSQLGTTQFWVKGSYVLASGANVPQIQQGLGYPIRNYVFENYDTSNSTRATGDTDWPSPVQFYYKGTLTQNINKATWREKMARKFGYPTAALDSANGLDSGVFVMEFNRDNLQVPGAELRNGYLQTATGDLIQLNGSWGAASTMYVLANYVAPISGTVASIRAGGR